MSISGLLLGLINIAIILAILVLAGALIVWVANLFTFTIPWNIQRLYLLVVLLIGIYMIVALLFGIPSIHVIGRADYLGIPLIARHAHRQGY